MFHIAWSLFVAGLVLGSGPCLMSCGPLLVSYITARNETPGQGVGTYVVFALTRLVIYLLLGAVAGWVGEWVLGRFFESFFLQVLFTAFGFFLVVFGLLIALSPMSFGGACRRFLNRSSGSREIINVIIFGIVVSLAPCLPLVAVLGTIALISDVWTKGLVYMFFFGLGTVLSPMVALAFFAGWVGRWMKKNAAVLRVVNVVCGLVLVYLGVTFLIRSLVNS
jgi:sulfite exporter TauE/SafE